MPKPDPLARLRALCLALPEAHEVVTWGEPTFRVRNRIFAMFAGAVNHHGGGRDCAWIKAAPGVQEMLVRAAPRRFFVPPYVGPSGWVGVALDGRAPWKEVEGLLRDGWRMTAPKRLVAAVEGTKRARAVRAKEATPATGASARRKRRR